MQYIFSSFLSLKNYFFKRNYDIPMIGCEESGKTSLINKLRIETGQTPLPPHIGITYSVNYKKLQIQEKDYYLFQKEFPQHFPIIWKHLRENYDALILVIDSTEKESIQDSCEFFWEYIIKSNRKFPVLILANKQDIKEALSLDDINFIFNLKDLKDRPIKIIGTSATNADEMIKGFDWLDNLL